MTNVLLTSDKSNYQWYVNMVQGSRDSLSCINKFLSTISDINILDKDGDCDIGIMCFGLWVVLDSIRNSAYVYPSQSIRYITMRFDEFEHKSLEVLNHFKKIQSSRLANFSSARDDILRFYTEFKERYSKH